MRLEEAGTTARAPITSTGRWLFVVIVVALVSGAAGCLVGNRTVVSVHTGSPMAGEHTISVEADGWTYAIPEDLFWRDAQGSWHDRGRPDCIPPMAEDIAPVTFGAVDVTAPTGPGWRQVVWVTCPG